MSSTIIYKVSRIRPDEPVFFSSPVSAAVYFYYCMESTYHSWVRPTTIEEHIAKCRREGEGSVSFGGAKVTIYELYDAIPEHLRDWKTLLKP